jgi:polyadenylation factor subunit 2
MIRIYDIRMMKELQILRGHPKEVCSLAWHPIHERLLVTGGSEGSVFFWLVGEKTPLTTMDNAHDANVWSIAWHPLGHVLATGSNDHATRFWTRCRPGDQQADRRTQEDATEHDMVHEGKFYYLLLLLFIIDDDTYCI